MRTKIFFSLMALAFVFSACNKDLLQDEADDATGVKAAITLPGTITPFEDMAGTAVDAKAFDKFGKPFNPRGEGEALYVVDGIFFVKTKPTGEKNAKMANFLVFEENPTPGTLTVQTKINGNKCFSYVFDTEKFARQAFRVDNGTSVRYEFTPKAATGGGSISGKVLADLKVAKVELYKQEFSRKSASLLKASIPEDYVYWATFDVGADGSYIFNQLPEGVYMVVVTDVYNHVYVSPPVLIDDGVVTGIVDFPLPFEGSGTSGDPFKIGTPEKLREFAGLMNTANYIWGFSYYQLTADIDLNDELWRLTGLLRGHFDGDGYKITGLYTNYTGLFGALGYNATVQNLGVEGAVISSGAAGGVAGVLNAGSSIINCYSNVSVTGGYSAGGVVGAINPGGRVINCYATGVVSCSGEWAGVGGVAGWVGDIFAIIDCAALNSSVTAPLAEYNWIGRVAGTEYSIDNCVSYIGITIPENTYGESGTSWTKEEIQTDGTLGGRFTSPVWTTENGKLPGFGAAVALPEHLR